MVYKKQCYKVVVTFFVKFPKNRYIISGILFNTVYYPVRRFFVSVFTVLYLFCPLFFYTFLYTIRRIREKGAPYE